MESPGHTANTPSLTSGFEVRVPLVSDSVKRECSSMCANEILCVRVAQLVFARHHSLNIVITIIYIIIYINIVITIMANFKFSLTSGIASVVFHENVLREYLLKDAVETTVSCEVVLIRENW